MRFTVIIAHLVALTGCVTTSTQRLQLPPLQAVAQVDLDRYIGTWFEIANFPQRFQQGCTETTATYTVRSDGDIDVLNQCREGSLDGELRSNLGRARVIDRKTNAKLQVSFFRPFWGDYWIIDLDDDYQYTVVGHPGRDYLWILSRTPTLAEETYRTILERLETRGYDTSRLIRTQQISMDIVQSNGPHDWDLIHEAPTGKGWF
jgi:apolipoprotein D and lipocalin family protein